MLRVYALPAVEAATPEPPNPSTPQSSVDTAADPALPASEPAIPNPAAAIAPPEALTAPEFSPTPTAPTAATQPDSSAKATSQTSDSPESSGPQAGPVESATPKPTPASVPKPTAEPASAHPEKAGASTTRTIAGMRQILEKRLGELVTQDKATREAQWQQNLLYTALQYAWAGRFDEARQIANHPALPEATKTELLGKILAIELQRQTNPVDVAQSAPAQPGTVAPQAGGRVVPPGFAPAGLGTTWSSSGVVYPGLPGGQCPAVPATKLLASKSVSLAQPVQPAKKAQSSQFPAFVPTLGQNLASRMVQHSRSQSVIPPSARAKSLQPYAPAISLIGVASGSLKQTALPKQAVTIKPTGTSKPAEPSAQPAPAKPSGSAALSTQTAQARPELARPDRPQTVTMPASPIQTPQPVRMSAASSSTAPSTVPLTPQPASLNPQLAGPAANQAGRQIPTPGLTAAIFPSPALGQSNSAPPPVALPKAEPVPTRFITPDPSATSNQPLDQPDQQINWALDPVSATVNRSLEKFESILPDWVPNPLNFAWIWWGEAELGRATPGTEPVQVAISPQPNSLSPVPLQQSQLTQSPVLGSLAVNWSQVPMQLEFGRSARKVSLPVSFTKPTAAPAKADLAELVALSCASAQLADRLNSYVIDPAVSKQLGWVNLMFPLPIASVITSAFGWRIHPISGNLSFHTGLDLGAPTGTPVLAALPGRVVGADYMGGYGLAVIVETSGQQRNLYAHLSGIAVQPGMRINQGTILGWVGSTGNSTGPHLHFETLVETKDGWTAVDPLISAAGSR